MSAGGLKKKSWTLWSINNELCDLSLVNDWSNKNLNTLAFLILGWHYVIFVRKSFLCQPMFMPISMSLRHSQRVYCYPPYYLLNCYWSCEHLKTLLSTSVMLIKHSNRPSIDPGEHKVFSPPVWKKKHFPHSLVILSMPISYLCSLVNLLQMN